MKRRALAFVALLATYSAPQLPRAVASASEPYKLNIATAESTIWSGSEVQVVIKLTNDSNVEIKTPPAVWRSDMGEILFTARVTKAGGSQAPLTAYSRWVKRTPMMGSAGIAIIPTGGAFCNSITITKLFDITAPGDYTIQVCTDWWVPGEAFPPKTSRTKKQTGICFNRLQVKVTL